MSFIRVLKIKFPTIYYAFNVKQITEIVEQLPGKKIDRLL